MSKNSNHPPRRAGKPEDRKQKSAEIAVIGEEYTIGGFAAFGIIPYPARDKEEAEKALNSLRGEKVSIIFITERFGRELIDLLDEINTESEQAVSLIPEARGSLGFAAKRVNAVIRKATGVEI